MITKKMSTKARNPGMAGTSSDFFVGFSCCGVIKVRFVEGIASGTSSDPPLLQKPKAVLNSPHTVQKVQARSAAKK